MGARDRLQRPEGPPLAEPGQVAVKPGGGSTTAAVEVLRLQRAVGNRAVNRLVGGGASGSPASSRMSRAKLQRDDGKPKARKRTVLRITAYIDPKINAVVFDLDDDHTLALPLTWNGKPPPDSYTVTYDATHGILRPPKMGGEAKDGLVLKWTVPPDKPLTYRSPLILRVVAGQPGGTGSGGGGPAAGGAGMGTAGAGGGGSAAGGAGAGTAGPAGGGPGAGSGAGGGTGPSPQGTVDTGAGGGEGSSTGAGPGTDEGVKPGAQGGSGTGDPSAAHMTPAEEALWRELYQKMSGAPADAAEDPVEQIRLYEILRSKVDDPAFSRTGTPWTQFARFLEKNADKIEGILRSGQGGRLTEEKIEQIIAQYGKFIATQPVKEDDRTELKTLEDFNKEFEYDPGWAKLSLADRKLLLEYARKSPDELKRGKIEFDRVTTSMKVGMALKLSWESWPGEIADAAKEAFSDPTFYATLLVMMGIYVALWLTPEPSGVTKFFAGALTAGLLLQFGIEDIYKFVVAWSDLTDACAAAHDLNTIQAAGDKFAKKVGQVGFDIILFIVMHRIGKRLGAKVRGKAAERLVKSAGKGVTDVEAQPGSGVDVKPPPGTPDLLAEAKAKVPGGTPTAILDALAPELSEAPRKGLARLRANAGDAHALRAVEGKADLVRFLYEETMTREAKGAVHLELIEAKTRLARAQLIQADTVADPGLRRAAKMKVFDQFKLALRELGVLDEPEVQDAVKETKAKADKVNKLAGVLGEAIQRGQLRVEFPEPEFKVLSNIAVAREVPGYKTIAEWKAAEVKAGRPGAKTANLVEHDGQVWKLLGEFDALIVQDAGAGKLRLIAGEDVKSGNESPSSATDQVQKAIDALRLINQGATDVRAFEQPAPQRFGSDITSKLDISTAETMAKMSRGPAGKGHAGSLPYDVELLKGVAESIVDRGLPPARAQPVVTPARPRDEQEPVSVGQ
jgi:hypothetical protein